MQLAYAQVEEMIAQVHQIMPFRRSALEGRLKHFKRLGFPAGVNTGRGRAAVYDASAVLRLLLAFELLQLGMMPERAVKIMRIMRFIVASAAGHGARFLERGEPDDPRRFDQPYEEQISSYFVLMDPAGLSGLIDPHDDGELTLRTLEACTGEELSERIFDSKGRVAVINTTFLIGLAAMHLRNEAGVPTKEFAKALRAWSDSFELNLDDD